MRLAYSVLCLIITVCLTVAAPSRADAAFSVDVYYNKTRIRLNAYPGINLTALAEKYFVDSGHPRSEKALDEIVEKLEARGGGDCDACKVQLTHLLCLNALKALNGSAFPSELLGLSNCPTCGCCTQSSMVLLTAATMVEVLSGRLHELVADQMTAKTESRVEGTGHSEKVVRSAFAGPDVIRRARSVCRSPEYQQFSNYHRKWCERAMASDHAEKILRRFAGKLLPSAVYERKDGVCTQLLGICPKKRVDSNTADSCRLCGEVMQDLSFLLRRSRRDIKRSEMVGTNPTTQKNLGRTGSGFMQRSHVMTHLEGLCEEMHLRQPWLLTQNLQEECEDLVSEHTDAIVASFRAMFKGGHGLMFPGREVCINTKLCKAKQYDSFMTTLQNFHFNFTSKTDKQDKSVKTEL